MNKNNYENHTFCLEHCTYPLRPPLGSAIKDSTIYGAIELRIRDLYLLANCPYVLTNASGM